MRSGLGISDVPIVRAKRLTARVRGPGLMTIEVPSLEHKLKLLCSSWKLKDNAHYRNVFIHSSKSHAECIAELNSWMILEENRWQTLECLKLMTRVGMLSNLPIIVVHKILNNKII